MSTEGEEVFHGRSPAGTGEPLKEVSRLGWKEPEGSILASPSLLLRIFSVCGRSWGQVEKGEVEISTQVKKKLANRCTAVQ